jgi:ribosomal protein S18 acetylase RimI-like enzyme
MEKIKTEIQLSLRNAKTSDLEITYRIKTNSIKPYVEKIWTWNDQIQKEIHETDFTASDTKIIELNGKEVGYLVLKEKLNEIHLENLLIENEFQNSGIGKAVMEKIIERANSEKKLIRLHVFKINIKAQKFYENLGFKKNSETENHIGIKKTGYNSSNYCTSHQNFKNESFKALFRAYKILISLNLH